mgnify:CR=1 FL=1
MAVEVLLSKERYPEGDRRIRVVAGAVAAGEEITEEMAVGFHLGLRQVAARVILRRGGGRELDDLVSAERVAINWGKHEAVRGRRIARLRRREIRLERPVEVQAEMRMMWEEVEKVMTILPELQHEVMRLLPTHIHSQICAGLGISDQALRNRLYRARALLERARREWE